MVFPKYRTAVFVNGCFWHKHPDCKIYSIPKTNVEYWMEKLETNRLRDERIYSLLRAGGWKVLVVWECELKARVRKERLERLYDEIVSYGIGTAAQGMVAEEIAEYKVNFEHRRENTEMNVLIVGGGGREHALAWRLSKSPRVKKLFCAPGNAGMVKLAKRIDVAAEDIAGIVKAAEENDIGLVVVGPEVPLAMGMVDELEAAGIKAFGPNKNCARLEASKSFTKDFLKRHGIPTARYKEFTGKGELEKAIGVFGFPMVLKADGLAAGKGVIIAETAEDAKAAIELMMGEKAFGAAGEKVVVEEFLRGVEASAMCFVDEKTIAPMESAQDYKRIFDNDEGPNTGGVGAYSPNLLFDGEIKKRVREEILRPTLKGLQDDGLDFKGVLYVGLMITNEGPKVIEFNNRFGDPETQVVLPRLETDLLEIMLAVRENRLGEMNIKWSEKKAVCVVLTSQGYPGSYAKGCLINGLENVDGIDDILVFHAGTENRQGGVATSGGRVIGVTALADTHEKAREKAYENAARITFEGVEYRKDIGIVKNGG